MPELPEVETVARGVHRRVRGQRIVQVWFGSHKQPFKTPAACQAKELDGRAILAVHRTGKHIVCELGAPHFEPLDESSGEVGAQWIVHLGMTGRLLVTTPAAPLVPHTHARLGLSGGKELRFVDPRRFGRLELRLLKRDASFSAPGKEPLAIGTEEFAGLFHRRRLPIKAALLNQTLLAGWGTSMPTRASSRPASGRAGGASGSARQSWSGYAWPCSRFFWRPSGWEVRRSQTMWMPMECAAFFNWNTASTSAQACLAGAAKRRFAGFWWPDAELTTVRSASIEADSMVFRIK